jgi:hypothetical protein
MTARAPVIRSISNNHPPGLLPLLPAWIISGGVHAVVLSLFLLITLSASAGDDSPIDDVLPVSTIEDAPTQFTPELGDFPELPPGIPDQERIGENMPGLPAPDQESGPIGNPEIPFVLQPPVGYGSGPGVIGTSVGPGAVGPFVGMVPNGLPGGIMQPGGVGARFARGETREKVLAIGGGNKASEAAVGAGLKWLALHQAPNGSWTMEGFHQHAKDQYGAGAKSFRCECTGQGQKNDVAGTAFGVLPFLAAGQTHKPVADRKNTPDYTKVVDNALRFLVAKQDKSSGSLGGMYEHGLATIALCEAYSMTSDPALKVSAQKGIDYIVSAQHEAGGWRYAAKQQGDTSVTGWQVMALKSGQMAGLSVPKATLDGATKYLSSCMNGLDYGYGYTGPSSTPTMTAVGLLCRQYLGWNPRKTELVKGVDLLTKTPPSPSSMYFSYYGTQVMNHLGGDNWRNWNEKMRDSLIKSQDRGADPKHPHQAGSWDPKGDPHGNAWGRVGQTSLSVLTLQVYYRHLPLYRRQMGTVKPDDEK